MILSLLGVGFIVKSDFNKNNPLLASLGNFFESNNNKKKIFLSEEEFLNLKEKIAFLENEIKKKDDQLDKLDDLTEQIDVLNQRMIEIKSVLSVSNNILDKNNLSKNTNNIKNETIENLQQLEGNDKKENIAENKNNDSCSSNSININTASAKDLEKLKNVGPEIAQRIIEKRPFLSLDGLLNVSGIGVKTLEEIKKQGCAYVDNNYKEKANSSYITGTGGSSYTQNKPTIKLSFPSEISVNDVINVEISASNLKDIDYDVKVSILKIADGSEQSLTISEIYDKNISEWKNSYNYIEKTLSQNSSKSDLNLRIKDQSFLGTAKIIAKIRESQTKTVKAQWEGEIKIKEAKSDNSQSQNNSDFQNQQNSDNTPPLITNGQPSGILASGIKEVNLSLETDEEAICKYSKDPNIDYDLMALFETTGNKSHSTLISDLSDGNSYTFYIKCADINGNKNSDDFIITFSIDVSISELDVVINEIAWMGTSASSTDEWIELYNNTNNTIDLTGWRLVSLTDNSPNIILDKTISPFGFYLLERSSDNTISDISADQIYTGALNNNPCEILVLYDKNNNIIDKTVCSGNNWPAGVASPNYVSMERINSQNSGDDISNWANNNKVIINGLDANGNQINGTPKSKNSVSL
jgi:DNA uptake protein ComE-like DNA-binding protein